MRKCGEREMAVKMAMEVAVECWRKMIRLLRLRPYFLPLFPK